ncbi:cysteine proteinase [Gonapodya prolifera JEL478]|uniref:Cysteine proteinase n=1 Tax=Gonapodya prolifera (strain JEL478) TaxID=1344416 RepID=A0A139AYW9_GONPJ|nr:cysteine proteinase [Gonapodya prolifera JEL478]|eukprot:KXS21948.1 cysteine proteinase [Gonapodya prolifera JEL478]
MNSIVQCTLATEYLVSYFAQGEWESDINSNARRGSTAKGKMAQAFSSLFNETCTRTSSTAISPNIFYRTVCSLYPQFSGYSQHDAQEFLRCILDGLHEDLRVPPTKPSKTYSEAEVDSWSDEKKARYSWDRFRKDGSSIILDLFGGLLHSSITCHRCKYRSSTFDFFMDLSVPIPQSGNDERPLLSFSRRSRSQKPVSLRECLDEFTADEILDGSEAYNCAKCKKPVKATKRLRVCKAPDLLVIHLKRFAYDTYSGEKIENVVDFPFSNLRIDNIMRPDVSPPSPVYDLYAVCGHSGSLHGGHYVAYTKSLSPYPPLPGSQQSSVHSLVESSAPLASPWTPDSPALPALRETWHLCNDSYVSPVNKAEAVSGAYVLFYKRRR